MTRLPVTGLKTVLRTPDGRDDLLLSEAHVLDLEVAAALLTAVVVPEAGGTFDWTRLPYADLEAALLLVRGALLGDRVRGETRCPNHACRERIDLSLGIRAYLHYHRPRASNTVETADPGWFRLRRTDAPAFRVPTTADVSAARRAAKPKAVLVQRCIAGGADARALAKIEKALTQMAPLCSDILEGCCPHCREVVHLYFDVVAFSLLELRAQALPLFDDVNIIARNYHWPEEAILALPRGRRIGYAERLRGGTSVA